MWTSALSLQGREFCSILNAAVRGDEADLADTTAVSHTTVCSLSDVFCLHTCLLLPQTISRAINRLCVLIPPQPPFPPGDVCFRDAEVSIKDLFTGYKGDVERDLRRYGQAEAAELGGEEMARYYARIEEMTDVVRDVAAM